MLYLFAKVTLQLATPMKLLTASAVYTFLFYVSIIPLARADLKTDKRSLLDFAAAVPHGPKLNWNPATSVCTSWTGVTCNRDGTNVLLLRLPAVGLVGSIPVNTIGKLDKLRTLSLRSNLLTGDLPSDVTSLPSLHYLYLQHNNFTGKIPSSIAPQLNVLDLSFNSFMNEIPQTIQNLSQLTALQLQKNKLSGTIPDLNVTSLNHMNISYNSFTGAIPLSLRRFPSSSFIGNSLLCGAPLKACSSPSPPPSIVPQKSSSKKKLGIGIIVAIAAGASVLLFLIVLVICLCCFKRKKNGGRRVPKVKVSSAGRSKKPIEDFGSGVQEPEKNKLVFFEGCLYNFDLEDLLRASAEVLGKGSYGAAYKAILEEATVVVVKRVKEVVVGKKDFEQQMEIIGRVGQHQNIVPLRAYYYSKDDKLLVCDYMPGGSLASLLHGNRSAGRTPLDWVSRVKILLGAARGIAHMHSAGGPKVSHGNIKSSNVLITQDFDGCISDFALTPLMNNPATSSRTAGYRAPEVMETRKHTHKSDVYSYGVLLLEMLTGKAPLQSPALNDMVDLPKWVQSVVSEEWTAEVFDVELMRYPNIEDQMVQMLQIAMACVAKTPDMRPTMDELIKMMEQVLQSELENQPSSEENRSNSIYETP